ncbi:uncharacterized protein LOC110989960 [Acanthaster planci]|uniref:Uncharacterized protein LOC110989960 n=1 Tax=Acanthaster planci TaxID=133434 RepID=A0A8B8A3B3_ACAPL|nr:uncharacterized protein LOC110989960 [Acanthaster planci]
MASAEPQLCLTLEQFLSSDIPYSSLEQRSVLSHQKADQELGAKAEHQTRDTTQVLDDDISSRIATPLGLDEWKKLAIPLGFEGNILTNVIEAFFPNQWKEQFSFMLEAWKQFRDIRKDQVQEKLCVALKEISKKGLADPLQHPADEVLFEPARRLGQEWTELASFHSFSSEETGLSSVEGCQLAEASFSVRKWNSHPDRNNSQFGKLCYAIAIISQAYLVSQDLHATESHQKVLVSVSKQFGPKWKEFALLLGFSASSESDEIMKENLGNDTTRSLVLLWKWKQRVHMTRDQLGHLCSAMTDLGKEHRLQLSLRPHRGRLESHRVQLSESTALQPESAVTSDVEILPDVHTKDIFYLEVL